MKNLTATFVVALCVCSSVYSQAVTAGTFSQYMADAPASASLGQAAPIQASALTDSLITMNIQAFPAVGPVAMVIDRSATPGATIVINAWNMFNVQMDINDVGGNGYLDQTLFDGFTFGGVKAMTDATGHLSRRAQAASCIRQANIPTCFNLPTFNSFEIGSQAIVTDPTNPPFNVRSTQAIQGTFTNGYRRYPQHLYPGDGFAPFSFQAGFSFNFYGVNYTQAFVSTNGYISFGAGTSTFPSPTVADIQTGLPRIMCFYNDLAPEVTSYAPNTRIYAQQFRDPSGLMKVKFGWDQVAEFGDQTGPHGGEIVITDNDDIATYVHGYNGPPSINTGVGITPGGFIDNNVNGFGVDLSALSGTAHVRPQGRAAFELFNHGTQPPGATQNSLDLIGFANNLADPVGRGVVFLKNPNVSNSSPATSSYIIQ